MKNTVLAAAIALGFLVAPVCSRAETKDVTVVLVHGAWADGSSWEKVIPLLQAKGIKVVAVQNPLTSLADDVTAAALNIDAGLNLAVTDFIGALEDNVPPAASGLLLPRMWDRAVRPPGEFVPLGSISMSITRNGSVTTA